MLDLRDKVGIDSRLAPYSTNRIFGVNDDEVCLRSELQVSPSRHQTVPAYQEGLALINGTKLCKLENLTGTNNGDINFLQVCRLHIEQLREMQEKEKESKR